ncbi:hypothetical protein ABZ671_18975 [Micromonospora sp. NPDC006766]|uniref:hypothetical protein n=1 Tax=Micromonospora sp. NPDC006766 TaxID=3154778 RepID=UPI0033CA64EC
MGIYISRAHHRHPRRARLTIGRVTFEANPIFWAVLVGSATWAAILCACAWL